MANIPVFSFLVENYARKLIKGQWGIDGDKMDSLYI